MQQQQAMIGVYIGHTQIFLNAAHKNLAIFILTGSLHNVLKAVHYPVAEVCKYVPSQTARCDYEINVWPVPTLVN